MEKIKKIIKSKLSKFRDEERGDGMTILMLIGLKHYFLLYPDQTFVQMPYLKFLCEKYLLEQENPESIANQLSKRKRLEQLQIQCAEINRKFRPDSMAHFPFADEYGSIGDVLAGRAAVPEIDLDNMGAPGRNRFILKVFEEMRLDRQGIRISDIPEALERLGIVISSKLRRTLLKARCKNVNGPLIPNGDNSGEPWEYMEKHVPLSLWKSIVKNFMRLRRQGIQPGNLQDVLPPFIPGHAGQPVPAYLKDGEDEEDIENYDQEYHENGNDFDISDDYDYEHSATDNKRDNNKGHGEEKSSKSDQKRSCSSRKSRIATAGNVTRQTVSSQHKISPVQARSRAYFQRLQRIPSRLGEVIKQDRFQHHMHQVQNDKDALAAIASRRVNVLTSQAPKLGWKNSAYQTIPQDAGTMKRHGMFLNETDGRWTLQPGNSRIRKHQQRATVHRLQQLDSGAATMEIADAFLQGQVGRDLLLSNPRGGDYRDYYGFMDDDNEEVEEMPPNESQQQSATLQEINISEQSSASKKPVVPTTNSSLQKKVDEIATMKALYEGQSGWKTTKGGWVADFGPVHTHHLYTGPDQYTSFLHDRKLSGQSNVSRKDHFSASPDMSSPSKGMNATLSTRVVRGLDHRADEADLLFARSRYAATEDKSIRSSVNANIPSPGNTNVKDATVQDVDSEHDGLELVSPIGTSSARNSNKTDNAYLSSSVKSKGHTNTTYTVGSSRKPNLSVSIRDPPSLASTPSSDDAALYAMADKSRGNNDRMDELLIDDNDYVEDSDEDVDILMSRLQSSVSLKDIASDNE